MESMNEICLGGVVELASTNFVNYLNCMGFKNVDFDFVEKNGFFLLIPQGVNSLDKGVFYVVSIFGHDSIAFDEKSVHEYQILDGTGYFEIDGNKIPVQEGMTITIYPNQKFYYNGNMSMIETITPNFDETKFHIIETVDYSDNCFAK